MFFLKRGLVTGITLALFSLPGFGLGLGEVALKSAEGEPLLATIPLTDVEGLTAENISVGLAAKDDFQLVGISMAAELRDLTFAVDLSNPGQPAIRITTLDPIPNHYLNLLIDVKWPSGRLLREYSLNLVTPTFLQENAKPGTSVISPSYKSEPTTPEIKKKPSPFQVDPDNGGKPPVSDQSYLQDKPVIQPAQQASRPVVVKQLPPSRNVQQKDTPPQSGTNGSSAPDEDSIAQIESYQVKAGDTLWSIASRLPAEYDMQQRMAVIRDLNPEAFINNDINLIKEGAQLLLPLDSRAFPQDNTDTANAQQGNTELAAEEKARLEQPVAEAIPPPETASNTTSSYDTKGFLSLSSNEETDYGDTPGGGRYKDSSITRGEFESSQEELDRSLRENAELETMVVNLQEQLHTMQRLMELQSEELQQLQAKVGNKPSAKNEVERVKEESAAWKSYLLYVIGFLVSLSVALYLVFFRQGKNSPRARKADSSYRPNHLNDLDDERG